jgi:hypothetical protein
MTTQEFSDQFDVLYNNIASNGAPGLDEYEKSVFLTKAQDEVVKNYFNPKSNKLQEGYDGSQKRQIDFSTLTRTFTVSNFTSPTFDNRGSSFSFPANDRIMMIINEKLTVERNSNVITLTVVPIRFDEYDRLMSKPFKRPLKNQAWRLINNSTPNEAEIIAGYGDQIQTYIARYIRRPKPIILSNLEGVQIDGETEAMTCELDPIIHEEILQRAVELAKLAWVGDANATVQSGQRSE